MYNTRASVSPHSKTFENGVFVRCYGKTSVPRRFPLATIFPTYATADRCGRLSDGRFNWEGCVLRDVAVFSDEQLLSCSYTRVPNVLTLSCKSGTGGLASSGAPLAAHTILPVQAARRRANSTCRRRLGRRNRNGGLPASTPS